MNKTLYKMMEKKLDKLSTNQWSRAMSLWIELQTILEEEKKC